MDRGWLSSLDLKQLEGLLVPLDHLVCLCGGHGAAAVALRSQPQAGAGQGKTGESDCDECNAAFHLLELLPLGALVLRTIGLHTVGDPSRLGLTSSDSAGATAGADSSIRGQLGGEVDAGERDPT